MSWSVQLNRHGTEIKSGVDKFLEQQAKSNQGPGQERHLRLMHALADCMRIFTEGTDMMVTIESSGHMGPDYGNMTLTARTWPVA